MTLRELEIFLHLIKNPSLTLTAKELNLSQSAVSFALGSLEKKLGEKLFNRIGKKIVLNERGRVFEKLIAPHYKGLFDAKGRFLSSRLFGELKISASKTIASYIMPKIYFDFLSKHKDVKIKSDTQNSTTILQQVKNGDIDMGFIESEIGDMEVIKKHFLDDELIVACSDKRQKRDVFVDEIDKKWILRESGSGTKDVFFDALQNEAKHIKAFMNLKEIEEIKGLLLLQKDTISPISKIAIQKELKEKKLFEIRLKNVTLKRAFYIIYHKDHTKTTTFDAFYDFALSSYAKSKKSWLR